MNNAQKRKTLKSRIKNTWNAVKKPFAKATVLVSTLAVFGTGCGGPIVGFPINEDSGSKPKPTLNDAGMKFDTDKSMLDFGAKDVSCIVKDKPLTCSDSQTLYDTIKKNKLLKVGEKYQFRFDGLEVREWGVIAVVTLLDNCGTPKGKTGGYDGQTTTFKIFDGDAADPNSKVIDIVEVTVLKFDPSGDWVKLSVRVPCKKE